jgi:hypothetical protein
MLLCGVFRRRVCELESSSLAIADRLFFIFGDVNRLRKAWLTFSRAYSVSTSRYKWVSESLMRKLRKKRDLMRTKIHSVILGSILYSHKLSPTAKERVHCTVLAQLGQWCALCRPAWRCFDIPHDALESCDGISDSPGVRKCFCPVRRRYRARWAARTTFVVPFLSVWWCLTSRMDAKELSMVEPP